MFKKWYNGVNNYVLDLEQLQRRCAGKAQQKCGLSIRLARAPAATNGIDSFRNGGNRHRLDRRQVCKELYPSYSTKVA
jgi:hypothetical protein